MADQMHSECTRGQSTFAPIQYANVNLGGTLPLVEIAWTLKVHRFVESFAHRPLSCAGIQLIYAWHTRCLWIKGPHDRPERANIPGAGQYCGVTLRPDVAAWIVADADVRDIANQVLLAKNVLVGSPWSKLFCDLEATPSAHAALTTLCDFLRKLTPPLENHRTRFAVVGIQEWIRRQSLTADSASEPVVASIARELAMSERHLLRIFTRSVGIGPKSYQQILRVRRCAHKLIAEPNSSLSQLAIGEGFSDQPHFTREIGRQIGLTPRAFRRQYRGTNYC